MSGIVAQFRSAVVDRIVRSSIVVAGGTLATAALLSVSPTVLPAPPPGHKSINYVQEAHVTGLAVSSVTTAGITTATGNGVELGSIFYGGTGSTFTSFTDNGSGNAWTDSGLGTVNSAAGSGRAVAAANSNLNGKVGHTFTVTFSGSAFPALFAVEINQQNTSGMVDKTASISTNAVTTHTSGSTGTLTQANNIVVGFGGPDPGSAATTEANNDGTYTEIINVALVAGVSIGIIVAYKNVTATTAQTYSFTTNVARSCAGIVLALMEAGGAAASPLRKNSLLNGLSASGPFFANPLG